ncbi:DNA polymerase III, beta subunit [Nautilia profundicola AmH]|uniref:Beta sliding clamp n=1 Tax=Nautilia profundicola (strain ATCC BAA-1463 / DSM 18972 / AmH) TaxID=598659 RepID=B9L736_NAUPA|nr:DNA polymerase III subunit beta [Nautilia profundicola]ACM92738.1 DNA polymerase III, beta subunit [Nautilia profundicola AmH]
MHIRIEKPVIESILNQIIPFTEKKDNTQITSHILIKANEKLILKATDKEIGIKVITNAEIIEPGTVTINGKRFLDIIKTLQNKEIEIKTEENQITITQDSSIYKLTSFNASEFPEFPNTDEMNKIDIETEELNKAIKKIYPVIDNNNPKYELNGALFDLGEKTNFVSTDTRRLAVYYSKAKARDSKIIVPKRSIAEIKRVIRDDMQIFYDDVYLILKNNEILFFTKLINGKFPAYEKIIPQSLKYELNIPKGEFLSHLKQVSIISNEVKITIKNDKIIFESISDETMQAKTSFDLNTPLEDFTFAVNSRYIMDFLNVIENDTFVLGLNEPNIPFVLKDENFITIVMPLNI